MITFKDAEILDHDEVFLAPHSVASWFNAILNRESIDHKYKNRLIVNKKYPEKIENTVKKFDELGARDTHCIEDWYYQSIQITCLKKLKHVLAKTQTPITKITFILLVDSHQKMQCTCIKIKTRQKQFCRLYQTIIYRFQIQPFLIQKPLHRCWMNSIHKHKKGV